MKPSLGFVVWVGVGIGMIIWIIIGVDVGIDMITGTVITTRGITNIDMDIDIVSMFIALREVTTVGDDQITLVGAEMNRPVAKAALSSLL